MKNPFSMMRAVLAATASLAMFSPRAALARLRAGNILLNTLENAEFTPQSWLHQYMASLNEDFVAGFERAPKRGANVGYVRRQPTTNTRPRVNYAKQNRRLLKQEPFKLYPHQRAMLRALKRDALTGVVSF